MVRPEGVEPSSVAYKTTALTVVLRAKVGGCFDISIEHNHQSSVPLEGFEPPKMPVSKTGALIH